MKRSEEALKFVPNFPSQASFKYLSGLVLDTFMHAVLH